MQEVSLACAGKGKTFHMYSRRILLGLSTLARTPSLAQIGIPFRCTWQVQTCSVMCSLTLPSPSFWRGAHLLYLPKDGSTRGSSALCR